MQVYLIRHTTPDIAKGICYGQLNIGLDEDQFEKELKVIQSKLPSDIEKFYSSPLVRCTQLAEKLCTDYEIDDNLMEMNFGKWENVPWSDIPEDELNVWMNNFVNEKTPNGESYRNLHTRCTKFTDSLLHKNLKMVAIITHAGNIRSIISKVLGLPLENSFRLELNYGCVVSISINKNEQQNKLYTIL